MKERVDYQQIDLLIKKYKNNENRDPTMEEILEKLDPYMKKFFNILKYGKADINDKDTRQFLKLFMNDADARKEMDKVVISPYGRHKAGEVSNYIQKLCETINENDLKQDLVVIMLDLVNKYELQKGVHFCGYLYNAYRYDVSRYVKKMTKDPMAFYIPYLLGDGEEYMDADLVPSAEEVFEESLDENWIEGFTCAEVFLQLNKFQRCVLKYYYEFNYSDERIAGLLQSNRKYISRQRIKAEEIIKNART